MICLPAPRAHRSGSDHTIDRTCQAELVQCPPHRQAGLLNQADDLQLLGGRGSHSPSPPSPVMLFFSSRSSSACSAATSFRAPASPPRAVTSLLVAPPAVSPASRRLPASRNSFDQL